MNLYYKLKDRVVVPATRDEACAAFEGDGRIVRQDTVGDYWISTVFLPIDHRLSGEGPPVVFETMVFDERRNDLEQERYCTWEEAEAGHARFVSKYQDIAEGAVVQLAMRKGGTI